LQADGPASMREAALESEGNRREQDDGSVAEKN
jgi:hypothetical protein